MNFTNLLASIKVNDVLKEPPSPEEPKIITQLRNNPPANTASLFDLISNLQPVKSTASSSRNSVVVGDPRSSSSSSSYLGEEDTGEAFEEVNKSNNILISLLIYFTAT